MRKRKLWVSILAGVMAVILTLGLVAGLIPSFAEAASSSTLKNQLNALKEDKKKLDKEISALESQLKGNLSEMEDIVEQKNTIDQQVFMLHEKVDNINEQMVAYTNLIADKQEELDEAQARLNDLNEKNRERIRIMEEQGKLTYWSVIFKASSFSDFLDRINIMREIAKADERRIQEMGIAAKEVDEAKKALEEELEALAENKKQLEASQLEMEKKREEADRLLADLVAIGEDYEKLLDEAEAAASKLKGQISDKQDAYDAAKREEQQAASSGSNNDYVASSAKWLVPCKYKRFTSPYGWRIHPVYNTRKFHYGVDLAHNSGTEIIASRGGKVTVAKYSTSAGYYVEIDHGDGFSSQYMHLTHYIVNKGDTVKAGQVIGYMGSTGVSTGPHLHFSILYKGGHVNPAKYIDI